MLIHRHCMYIHRVSFACKLVFCSYIYLTCKTKVLGKSSVTAVPHHTCLQCGMTSFIAMSALGLVHDISRQLNTYNIIRMDIVYAVHPCNSNFDGTIHTKECMHELKCSYGALGRRKMVMWWCWQQRVLKPQLIENHLTALSACYSSLHLPVTKA